MKTKMFEKILIRQGQISEVENEINSFIQGKEVKQMTQSVTPYIEKDGRNSFYLVITIIYDEK